MQRTLIADTTEKIDETVLIQGWVKVRRDHGKIVFLDVVDKTAVLQVVVADPSQVEGVTTFDVVSIEGTVAKRPEKLVNPKLETGTIELQVKAVNVLAKSAEMPFDMTAPDLDLQLPTLLDHRSLTLRHAKVKAIFEVQAAIAEGFRQAAKKIGCIEVFPPTISASATEGGAEVFHVDYYGHSAYMVQSPQLYKQMMVGVFERVFIISHIYRAEPSVTTRHLAESIQLDCEIGFIQSFEELLDALEFVYAETIKYAQDTCEKQLALLGVEKSNVEAKVPRLTMREAQELIYKRTGSDHRSESDLMPEDERELGVWAKEEHDSDLVTVTHYPTKKRAFYSMPDPKNPEYSLSYDLLYKGLEMASGAKRIDTVEQLVAVIKERGMNPESFTMYLQAFTYGMPPHGGFSYGLERTTMKLLNLANIREASLFPRDMERVDFRLSTLHEEATSTKQKK